MTPKAPLKADQVLTLYQKLKTQVKAISDSHHGIQILDTIFANPIIESTRFIKMSGMNNQTGPAEG